MFLALDLPSTAREAIAGWRDRVLASRDELRPIPVAGLHVTLVFLGGTDPARVAAVWEAASGAVPSGPPPLLAPAGLLPIPRRRPRLVALDLTDEGGRAAALQHAVTDSLSAGGLHEPEGRPFWPHVTLARLRKGAEWRPLKGSPDLGAFDAVALTLYRSHQSPSGARYEALCRRPLGSAGDEYRWWHVPA